MKIIISATTSWNIYNSRIVLARALKQHGHEVILLAPRDEFSDYLLQEGFRWEHLPLKPRGKNVLQEVFPILFMAWFYLREKPDVVNHFTPKGVIYGSLAAKISGIPRVFNTITGLGHAFSDSSRKRLQNFLLVLYRIALAKTSVVFQNPDDKKLFTEKKIVTPRYSYLILGSGVDMNKFQYSSIPQGKPIVLLSSRFVEEKGIRYFVDAAKKLKSKRFDIRMVLVGKPEEDQPTSIKLSEITKWINEEIVEWWGWHNDMERVYPLASIVCLPTYYMEGVPKVLIEAAACGRPLIATDVPGCREIIRNEYNGILIPSRDSQALSEAVEKILGDSSLCEKMGQNSREIAVDKFSAEKVVASYFDLYKNNYQLFNN